MMMLVYKFLYIISKRIEGSIGFYRVGSIEKAKAEETNDFVH